VSSVVAIDPGIGLKKLGQPVPLSNLVCASNRGWPQPAQANVPGRFSYNSAHEPGASVACCRNTRYCSGVKRWRHSASVSWNGKDSFARTSMTTSNLLCHAR
jgi:hypothetical protein